MNSKVIVAAVVAMMGASLVGILACRAGGEGKVRTLRDTGTGLT